MEQNNKATLQSQLGNDLCMTEDTEEMFWLREADDYQSMVKLGDALSKQYRFKEAIEAYEKARSVRSDDGMLYMKLGGASLTLFRFEDAENYYDIARSCGTIESTLAYPLGVCHYLKGEYGLSAECFEKCLPCNDELKIAVIYWHTLASYRAKMSPFLLEQFSPDMDVGHHTAYKEVVSLFKSGFGEVEPPEGNNPLDKVIVNYGLSVYCEHLSRTDELSVYLEKALECDAVWPSISYLTAWNDKTGV